MKLSTTGAELIKHYEGCKLEAYLCPAKKWTIGFGNTFYPSGKPVKKGDKITKEQAHAMFPLIVPTFEHMVYDKVKRPLQQHEFDALVDFCYNCGTSYRLGTQYKDYALFDNVNKGVTGNDLMIYWHNLAITANKVPQAGLKRRRKSEVLMFLTGELNFFQ